MMKTAVVTGASGGIGAAFARTLAEEGYAVALGARRLEVVEELAATLDTEVLAHRLDVSDAESVASFRQAVLDRFDSVDAVIANAGVGAFKRLEEFSPEEFDRLFAVNVRGAWLSVRAFLEPLKARHGMAVLVSSDVSARTFPTGGPYCATKFALRALARTLQQENPELRVLELRPGSTDTGFGGGATDERRPEHFLDVASVAETLRLALRLPAEARLEELVVRPVGQPPEY